MSLNKSETLTVRIEPTVKDGLKVMASQERRSQANMIEIMIRDYCQRNGVDIEDVGTDENNGEKGA